MSAAHNLWLDRERSRVTYALSSLLDTFPLQSFYVSILFSFSATSRNDPVIGYALRHPPLRMAASSSNSGMKVVLLGEGRVGKTSCVARFIEDAFDADSQRTVQAKMYVKKRLLLGAKAVDLAVWDTAGQEAFHALGPLYYRNAKGALLVYDLSDDETFERVKMWMKELKKSVGPSIRTAILANKCDLVKPTDERVKVHEAEAREYAKEQGALYFVTSAKNNVNVTEAFHRLAEDIVNAEREQQATAPGGAPRHTVGTTDELYGSSAVPSRGGAAKGGKRGLRVVLGGEGDAGASQPPPAAIDASMYTTLDNSAEAEAAHRIATSRSEPISPGVTPSGGATTSSTGGTSSPKKKKDCCE